jgi:molybdopterin converting factor subunit 1
VIKVLFFGMLRDIAEMREEACELPAMATLGGVFDAYATRFPRLRELRRSIVLARNQQFCDPAAPVADGDEIAFLPPVSGGSGTFSRGLTDRNGNFFALTPDPIETAPLVSRTQQDSDGAVVIFECRVRNNNQGRPVRCLEYECGEAETIRALARLGADLAEHNQISRITVVHRLGKVPVGEARVVIVVAAAHRKPAFAVAMEAMDRLKSDVAIWKKEYFEDGAVQAEGPSSHAVLLRNTLERQ